MQLDNLTKTVALRIINLLHLLFVLFIVFIPFININYFLLVHAVITPFLIAHWYTENDMCILTLIEKEIRKSIIKNSKDNELNENDDNDDKQIEKDCFTCKLIGPVYNFVGDYKEFSKLIYGVTFFLWLISSTRLLMKYKSGRISSFEDLFLIQFNE